MEHYHCTLSRVSLRRDFESKEWNGWREPNRVHQQKESKQPERQRMETRSEAHLGKLVRVEHRHCILSRVSLRRDSESKEWNGWRKPNRVTVAGSKQPENQRLKGEPRLRRFIESVERNATLKRSIPPRTPPHRSRRSRATGGRVRRPCGPSYLWTVRRIACSPWGTKP